MPSFLLFTFYFLLFTFLGLDLDVGYYLHLVRGQARLLWNREPIEKVLKRPDLDPETRERLWFIREVRRFAESEIGLARSENFTALCDIGAGPVSWNLTACPKDRLEPVHWSYPVVGSAPYRGFFDRKRAERERDRLAEEGYDTYLYPVGAYSTLGWFEDPVLSSMLRYRDEDLADLIVHELTHGTVWVSENVPFNEGMATFVGETGSLLFLETRYGSGSPEVKEALGRRADQRLFVAFMRGLARDLETIYRSDLPTAEKLARREPIFETARTRFAALPMATDRYSTFPTWELNNARMTAYRTYHRDLDIFERVYGAVGHDLKAAVTVFKGCEGADDAKTCLEDWLQNR